MKKILLPTDFSVNSSKAVDYAVEFASHGKMDIILCHIYRIPVIDQNMPAEMLEQTQKEIISESEDKLNKLRKYITEHPSIKKNGGITCSIENRSGFVTDEILSLSEEKDADLIIMGTKDAEGVGEYFFGSNTAKVIEESVLPVLAIPEEARFHSVKHILYAADLSNDDFYIMEQLQTLAQNFNADISVLHINEDTEQQDHEVYKEKMEQQSDYKNIRVIFLDKKESFEEQINEFARENSIDLLAMLKHKRGFFESLFHRSLTRKMSMHTHVPLLAFRK